MAARIVFLEKQRRMSEVGIEKTTGNLFEARLLRDLRASKMELFSLMMYCDQRFLIRVSIELNVGQEHIKSVRAGTLLHSLVNPWSGVSRH